MTSGYLFGVGTLLVFWVLSYFVTGKKVAPWALAISQSTVGGQVQGVLSASKLQALVWTLVTLFAYASVFGTRLLESEPGAGLPSLPSIPVGLLVLMGLSVATAAGAKGVTVSYKSQGLIEERSGGLTTNPKQGLCTNAELYRSRISLPHKQRQDGAVGVLFPHWIPENGLLLSFLGGNCPTGAAVQKRLQSPC